MKNQWLLGSIATVLLVSLGVACGEDATPTPRPPPPTPTSVVAPTSEVVPVVPTIVPTPEVVEGPQYGGTLNVVNAYSPPSLDIHTELAAQVSGMLGGIYESLIAQNTHDATELIPSLAESWDVSADGLKVTFSLRKNVKFHDGTPFTSADVKASYDRMLDPEISSPRGGGLLRPFVKSVEAPDDFTFVIHLKNPNAAFFYAAASRWAAILPIALLENQDEREQNPVGTGPFKWTKHERSVVVEWERNDDWWGEKPYLDEVHRFIIRDNSTIAAGLAAGRLHVGGTATLSDAELAQVTAGGEDKLILTIEPSNQPVALYINGDRPPFDDARVRQAIFMAIDRPDLSKRAREGEEFYSNRYLDPRVYGDWALPEEEVLTLPGFRTPKDQDWEDAKALLADAGFPDGFEVQITVRRCCNYVEDAQVVMTHLDKIGLAVNLRTWERTSGLARIEAFDYQLAIQGLSQLTTDPGLSLYGGFFNNRFIPKGTPQNILDDLDAQFAELDREKRKNMVWDIQRWMYTGDNNYAILGWGSRKSLVWWYVGGWVQVPFQGNPMNHVWLEPH